MYKLIYNSYGEYLKNHAGNSMHLNETDASEIYTIMYNRATKDTKFRALKIANGSYSLFNNQRSCWGYQ